MFQRPFALPFMFCTNIKNREGEQIFYRLRSRMQTGSFRGHLVEGSWYPAVAPCGIAHQKLIWRRLLWHRRALICCQCDEDAEPNTPSSPYTTYHNPPQPPTTPPPQHRASNPRDLFTPRPPPSPPPPSPVHTGKVTGVTGVYIQPIIAPVCPVVTPWAASWCGGRVRLLFLFFSKGDETLSPCRTRAQQ